MNRRRSYSVFVRRARFSQGVVNRDTAISRLDLASRPIHDVMSARLEGHPTGPWVHGFYGADVVSDQS